MPTSLVVICFGTLALVIGAGASHETTVNVTGERVVNDILDRFNETGLETSDTVLLFMRRMAWVESKFGSSPYTFRRGFYGGIWQKNRKAFLMTQRFKIYPVLREKYQQIKDIFGIDWLRTSWRESRKPLYSALTAWLYLCLYTQPKNLSHWRIRQSSGSTTQWSVHLWFEILFVMLKYLKVNINSCNVIYNYTAQYNYSIHADVMGFTYKELCLDISHMHIVASFLHVLQFKFMFHHQIH